MRPSAAGESARKGGVKYSEIEPAFLAPADARAAFEKGAVDAWVIWAPFQAAAEAATGARTLANGDGLVSNHQFYLATDAATIEQANSGRSYQARAVTAENLGDQQQIADAFLAEGLLPKKVNATDVAIWQPGI